MKSAKAQVSAETMAAIIILLLTLVLVLIQNNNFQEKISFLNSTELQKADCSKIVSAVNLVHSTRENSQIEIKLLFDANVFGGFVEMQDYYCEFHGLETTAQLSRGAVLVSKENGVLTIANK